jgi:hypothetical protein
MFPEGVLVHLLPDDATPADGRDAFLRSAHDLASGARCEGCGIRRTTLRWPSLETALPNLYAIAMINHARVLAALAQATEAPAADSQSMLGLADVLQARAAEVDEETAKRFR